MEPHVVVFPCLGAIHLPPNGVSPIKVLTKDEGDVGTLSIWVLAEKLCPCHALAPVFEVTDEKMLLYENIADKKPIARMRDCAGTHTELQRN